MMKSIRYKSLLALSGAAVLLVAGCSQQGVTKDNNGLPPGKPLPSTINGFAVSGNGSAVGAAANASKIGAAHVENSKK